MRNLRSKFDPLPGEGNMLGHMTGASLKNESRRRTSIIKKIRIRYGESSLQSREEGKRVRGRPGLAPRRKRKVRGKNRVDRGSSRK